MKTLLQISISDCVLFGLFHDWFLPGPIHLQRHLVLSSHVSQAQQHFVRVSLKILYKSTSSALPSNYIQCNPFYVRTEEVLVTIITFCFSLRKVDRVQHYANQSKLDRLVQILLRKSKKSCLVPEVRLDFYYAKDAKDFRWELYNK